MMVSDDGVGLPEGLDPATVKTLGLQLVHALVGQIGGALKIGPGLGATFQISWNG